MGLLDEYDRLLGGKPKIMPLAGSGGFDPTAAMGMTAGDELDPFGSARRAEALEVRGAAPPNIPGGTLAGPNQQRAYAGPQARNLGIAQADAAPPKTNLAEMNFGLGDNFPAPKNPARLAEGNPMRPPAAEPTSGLLAGKPAIPAGSPFIVPPKPPMPTAFAEKAPLPPPRGMLAAPPPSARAELPPRPAPAMPVPRPPAIGNMAGLPQSAPMPPVRPPELGGINTAALSSPAPIADTPIIGMGGGSSASTADAGSAIGGAGAAAGGMDALGGILGGIGGLVSAFGGGKKGAAPQAKAPTLSPSNAGPTVDAEIAQDRQMAPQILAGILANSPKSLLDPRKQRRA